ncbi:MAG: lysostaphin resistance A-like protein [Candidatus Saccharimonadales bacterium]
MSTNIKKSATAKPSASKSAEPKSPQKAAKNAPSQFAVVKWSPWAAIIVVIFTYLAAQIVAINLADLYPLARHWTKAHSTMWLNSSTVGYFVYILLAEAITVALIFGFVRLKKAKFSSIGLQRPKWQDLPLAFIGVVIYFVIYFVAVAILSKLIPSFNVSQSQSIGFATSTAGWRLILVLLSLVILPPIAEEIMFRGFLYSGLRRRLPFAAALIITSLLFAAPHLLESKSGGLLYIAGVDTFILSSVLCFIREKTGRIYAGMGAHGLKNFVAFAALFLVHVH